MSLSSPDDVEDLVLNPGRARILTSLTSRGAMEFVQLRSATGLTDGNLASHTRRLSGAGLVGVEKHIRDGKPVTTITLTPQGRAALEGQVDRLMRSIRRPPADLVPAMKQPAPEEADDWID